jgi:hypothetical protein
MDYLPVGRTLVRYHKTKQGLGNAVVVPVQEAPNLDEEEAWDQVKVADKTVEEGELLDDSVQRKIEREVCPVLDLVRGNLEYPFPYLLVLSLSDRVLGKVEAVESSFLDRYSSRKIVLPRPDGEGLVAVAGVVAYFETRVRRLVRLLNAYDLRDS